MTVAERVVELAKLRRAADPVVSVYLNTRWADEHQRERVRVFLKTELRQARKAGGGARASDLDWIEAQGAALIEQAQFAEADGVALFACEALGLHEILPVRAEFDNTFVVAREPLLRPLVASLAAIPPTLVVFVDGESARLIPAHPRGVEDEVRLESDVPGQHKRGGWAALAQSRYQRHIQDHRDRHLNAVADTLIQLVGDHGIARIVLAGEPRTLAAFRPHLPEAVAGQIAGSVSGARHEPAAVLLGRAGELVASQKGQETEATVEQALTEAAKSGRAVAGLEETLEAAARGAVHRLFLLEDLREPGRVCGQCGGLQGGDDPVCRLCGNPTVATELAEALLSRVVAAGGTVSLLPVHEGLARVGGLAALLRYPL